MLTAVRLQRIDRRIRTPWPLNQSLDKEQPLSDPTIIPQFFPLSSFVNGEKGDDPHL